MHALLAELFPWIVALCVVDGLADLRRGHLLFVIGARRARLLRAGLHVAGLWPLEQVIAAHDLPFLLAPGRAFLFDPRRRSDVALVTAHDLTVVPRDELRGAAREGRKVTAAGRTLLVAPTPEWAEHLRATLAADGRPGAAAADLEDAVAVRAAGRPFVASLRCVAALLWAGTFVMWPLAAYAPETFPVPAEALLAALAALVVATASLSAAMLHACGEGVGRSVRAGLHLLCYPPAALRPLAHAPRSLYRRFDAAVVAAALLPAPAFAAWAAREVRRARLSRAVTPPELAPAWDDRVARLCALLAAVGVDEGAALVPPGRMPGAASWCPLCEAQYRPGFETCADCAVPAERFPSEVAATGAA